MCGNGIREVRDDGKAVPGIRSLVGRVYVDGEVREKVGVGSEHNILHLHQQGGKQVA